MKPTALGNFLVIVPNLCHGSTDWYVHFINAAGNWTGSRVCKTKEEARIFRQSLRRHHKKLEKIYAARRRKARD